MSAPDRCPSCGAQPFDKFLPRVFVRSAWRLTLARVRAWIAKKPDPGRWAVICRTCKSIVGYEA